MEVHNNYQQMELKLARATEAMSVEQAARADAEQQVRRNVMSPPAVGLKVVLKFEC